MHIYFSGIGGVGMAPLAVLAKEAGYDVSGSDIKQTQYFDYLKNRGITDLHVGQTDGQIANLNIEKPIDWFVYSSALNTVKDHPELEFCKRQGIKTSKRDELINEIISKNKLKLIAIAGTHGKTTTTAMTIWALQKIGIKASHLVGATLNFAEMGHYEPGAEYFVYECDEFDHNFLHFHPFFSIVSGVAYDHHEIYPTQEDYNQAFRDFLGQSQRAIVWEDDATRLGLDLDDDKFTIENKKNSAIGNFQLPGTVNREDAWLVTKAVSQITEAKQTELESVMNSFPGVSRRFERIVPNLYSDEAHTPEKIAGAMGVALETAARNNQKVVIVYEPLTNRRMHYLGAAHKSVFTGASAVYWLPSFLAREDPDLPILKPEELIKHLDPQLQLIASPAQKNEELKTTIQSHLDRGDMVVAMAGGGGASLDEWLRKEFL
jgi:UDP-N-acetylmuramate--alanine ligase